MFFVSSRFLYMSIHCYQFEKQNYTSFLNEKNAVECWKMIAIHLFKRFIQPKLVEKRFLLVFTTFIQFDVHALMCVTQCAYVYSFDAISKSTVVEVKLPTLIIFGIVDAKINCCQFFHLNIISVTSYLVATICRHRQIRFEYFPINKFYAIKKL